MRVPLTVSDFLERAELVYGERVGVVDEPDQPAGAVGRAHVRARSRAGHGRRPPASTARRRAGRAGRDRVAELGAAAHVALRRERLGPGARADQLPPQRRARSPTSSSTRAPTVLLSIPSSTTSLRRVDCEAALCWAPRRDAGLPLRRRARAVGRPTKTPPRRSTTPAAPPPAQGRAADAPQHLAQRRGLRAARRRQGSRRVPAHAADVPLQRVGDDLRASRAWAAPTSCCARSTARRSSAGSATHGVTLLCGAPAVLSAVLDAAGEWDGTDPGARPGARRRGRRTAADADDRAHRDGARLGVRPDLRPHRDVPAAHDEPQPGRVGRAHAARARPAARPGRRAGARRALSWSEGEVLARSNVVIDGLLGAARGDRRGASRAAGSTPATAASSTTRAT